MAVGLKSRDDPKNHIDAYCFSSALERERYIVLRGREMKGEISDLEVAPKFVIEINGKFIAWIVMSFSFRERGQLCVEDVSRTTALASLKRRLVEVCHNLKVYVPGRTA
jgi:Protein of unknown function (DUF1064)